MEPQLLDRVESGLALSREVSDLHVEVVEVGQLAAQVGVGTLEPGVDGLGIHNGGGRSLE